MKTSLSLNSQNWAVKIILIVVSSLLLLIPLYMVQSLIREREITKYNVEREVAKSYGLEQIVGAPKIKSTYIVSPATAKEAQKTNTVTSYPVKLDYRASVETDLLHRSIYDIIVYQTSMHITGKLPVSEYALKALSNILVFTVSDYKGLACMPQMKFGDEKITFEKSEHELVAKIKLPADAKEGDEIPFSMVVNLKGTKSLMFSPDGDETSLTIESSYPHPSFQGEFLPDKREVSEDGFFATWNVLKINKNNDRDMMGVCFVIPANPYQQATRSAEYGILIIVLVFVAGLLVEFLTGRNIHCIQYAIIGLSLVLFYALLLSFSELMSFGIAYLTAAAMTTVSLGLYFRGILKSRSGYLFGVMIAFMYAVNYFLLQMETFGILSGSLLLFAVLGVLMYFTAGINEKTIS